MIALNLSLCRTALALLVTLFYVTAHAASFDCNAASSAVEHLICTNSDLSLLDEEMSKLYSRYIASSDDSAHMRANQRLWLRNVRNRCTTSGCLHVAYVARIKFLNEKANALTGAALCETVAQYANNGTLFDLRVNPVAQYEEAKKLLFEPGSPTRDLLTLWEAPMGKKGRFVYVGEFHAQQVHPTLYIRAANRSGEILEIYEGDFDSGSYSFRLIRIENTYYILGMARVPTKLWSITDDLELAELCAFRPNPKPVVQLVKGMNDSICKAAESGKGSYAAFSGDSQITLPREPRFRAMYPILGATLADIDNDGEDDRVIRLSFSIGNGRECDTYFLAVTDEQGKMIPDNNVNRVLRQTDECVASGKDNIGILTISGTNYIDAKGWFGNRSVYLVTPNELRTVCKFSGRTLTEVSE